MFNLHHQPDADSLYTIACTATPSGDERVQRRLRHRLLRHARNAAKAGHTHTRILVFPPEVNAGRPIPHPDAAWAADLPGLYRLENVLTDLVQHHGYGARYELDDVHDHGAPIRVELSWDQGA